MDCGRAIERLAQMTDSFEALLAAPPPPDAWPEWVQRASALLAHYTALARDVSALGASGAGKLLLIPHGSSDEALTESIQNIILRTRWAPEVETRLCVSKDLSPDSGAPTQTSDFALTQAHVRAYHQAADILQDLSDALRAGAEEAMAAGARAQTPASPVAEAGVPPDLEASLALYYRGRLL